ncbi:MAG: GNAT family N-acetyltransferase [Microcoleaceae cyanobacterium]
MTDQFLVRRMTRSELNIVISWAETEGWNPGRDDADTFYNTDPQGFFVGVLNQEVIGAISAVAYDQFYGFIGFYLVKPEYRGRGYGYAIWQEAIAYMGDRNVGLD